MENYWLKRHLDLASLRLRFDLRRLKILEPLLRETAYFAVDLERTKRTPSWLDEKDILAACKEGTYDYEEAKCWVFLNLYGHAVRQANTIGLLIEQSCTQEGLQHWRSLFEAYVICEFLARECESRPQLLHDYIIHGLLSSWKRYAAGYNDLCKRRGKKPRYGQLEIDSMASEFKDRFGANQGDYLWTKSVLGITQPSGRWRTVLILIWPSSGTSHPKRYIHLLVSGLLWLVSLFPCQQFQYCP